MAEAAARERRDHLVSGERIRNAAEAARTMTVGEFTSAGRGGLRGPEPLWSLVGGYMRGRITMPSAVEARWKRQTAADGDKRASGLRRIAKNPDDRLQTAVSRSSPHPLQAGGRRFDPGWLHQRSAWKATLSGLQRRCPRRSMFRVDRVARPGARQRHMTAGCSDASMAYDSATGDPREGSSSRAEMSPLTVLRGWRQCTCGVRTS